MKEKQITPTYIQIFLLLIIASSLSVSVHAQNQTGFISLDCGRLPSNTSYNEPSTGITYISDSAFIETGESKKIQPQYSDVLQEQAAFVRSFPRGSRNCYSIGVPRDTKYLIRATFLYGNYDGLNELPQFDIHIGVSLWDTVTVEAVAVNVIKDVIHVATRDVLRVCLVNTGSGTPFITALELRPLRNNSYVTPSGSLSLYLRGDVGATANTTVHRYPFDVHDRLWFPYVYSRWTQLATTETVNTNDQKFQPAPIILATAGTPVEKDSPMQFGWTAADPATMYYVYMYFAEVVKLAANETRMFNVMLNDELFYGPVVADYLSLFTISTPSGLNGGNFTFSIVKLENSTHPPILNGIEIYTWVDLTRSETNEDDADAIAMIKSAYGVEKNWEGDPCLPLEYAWMGLNCSFDEFEPPRITSLNLSSSGLTGEISSYISNLTQIESLDLSNNSLSGSVPSSLTQLTNLKILNLERNNLTGSVPAELIRKSESGLLSLSVGENPDLCSTVSCGVTEESPKKNSVLVPIIASVCGSVVLMLIIAVIVFSVLKRKRRLAQSRESDLVGFKKRSFTYSEIVKMTNNFEKTLGKGGFGTVFFGTTVTENMQVAVKMLSPPKAARGNQNGQTEDDSMQSFYHQQFQAEVKLLMRVHHGNLLSLIGYCDEGDKKALIYEFMSNGDLSTHILGGSNTNFLSWETRLQISIDSAQGLEYLHTGCKPPIVHRDVKTTNILLDDRFQAKMADFGLSKVFPTDDKNATHVSTRVAGTRGYLDPEYFQTGRLNDKSDVYSFGVVLLEIITGRPALIRIPEETTVIQWVDSVLSSGDINSIVQPRLRGEFDINSAWKAVELAMACVSRSPNKRPTMSQVVAELKECLAAESTRRRDISGNIVEPTIDSGDDILDANVSPSEIRPLAR